MVNKNVILAKKELIQFLKKNNAVATYFWTVYGFEPNSINVKKTLAKIAFETRANELCQLYKNLIGKLYSNPNIKDETYHKTETLCKLYSKWVKHVNNKFHIIL